MKRIVRGVLIDSSERETSFLAASESYRLMGEQIIISCVMKKTDINEKVHETG